MIGGAVVLMQYNDDTFGLDYEETPADRSKRSLGTGLLIGGITGFLGLGALSVGAFRASNRSRGLSGFSAMASRRFTGVTLTGRF